MIDQKEHYLAKDALGNSIIIGKLYGYSQQQNGFVTIVIGEVEKITNLRITLKNVKERSGIYGSINMSFTNQERKRTVNGCHLFPLETWKS